MRTRNVSGVTPQRKMIHTNDKFGNPGIAKQQGTTRTIYDSIPIDGRNNFRFFEDATTRQFPFTNMNTEGNKLGVGGALAVERCYLQVVLVGLDGVISDIVDVATYVTGIGIELGELNIELANSKIAKQIAVASFDPRWNKSAQHSAYNNFEFDTQLVIPPLLEFVFDVRTNSLPASQDYLRLCVEGAGAIIAPRNTF